MRVKEEGLHLGHGEAGRERTRQEETKTSTHSGSERDHDIPDVRLIPLPVCLTYTRSSHIHSVFGFPFDAGADVEGLATAAGAMGVLGAALAGEGDFDAASAASTGSGVVDFLRVRLAGDGAATEASTGGGGVACAFFSCQHCRDRSRYCSAASRKST